MFTGCWYPKIHSQGSSMVLIIDKNKYASAHFGQAGAKANSCCTWLPACPRQTSSRRRTCIVQVTFAWMRAFELTEIRNCCKIPSVWLRAHGIFLACVCCSCILAHHAKRSSEPSNIPISNDNLRRNISISYSTNVEPWRFEQMWRLDLIDLVGRNGDRHCVSCDTRL